MTMRLILTLGAAVLLGAGCASPREHYYTLVAAGARMAPTDASPAREVVVETVALPESVDRAQLVVEAAPHERMLLEQERWIEPLAADVQRAVAQRLAALLPDTLVLIAGDHGVDAAARHLFVQVRDFDLNVGRGTRLEAHWVILDHDRKLVREGDLTRQEPVASRGYAALVQAQAAAVAALADNIEPALR